MALSYKRSSTESEGWLHFSQKECMTSSPLLSSVDLFVVRTLMTLWMAGVLYVVFTTTPVDAENNVPVQWTVSFLHAVFHVVAYALLIGATIFEWIAERRGRSSDLVSDAEAADVRCSLWYAAWCMQGMCATSAVAVNFVYWTLYPSVMAEIAITIRSPVVVMHLSTLLCGALHIALSRFTPTNEHRRWVLLGAASALAYMRIYTATGRGSLTPLMDGADTPGLYSWYAWTLMLALASLTMVQAAAQLRDALVPPAGPCLDVGMAIEMSGKRGASAGGGILLLDDDMSGNESSVSVV